MNKQLSIWLLLFIFTGCAKQGFPPGGPEDKTPPQIAYINPDPGSTNVPLNAEITFEFDEPLDKSVIQNVFITPFQPGESLRIIHRGKSLRVRFRNGLKPDQTYVITLGTGIRDYRNNAMSASYTLAFSTGLKLDKGRISGRVFGEGRLTGADVWAYRFNASELLDPGKFYPDYIVQCEADGHFTFTHMAPGQYRLFAVTDRLRDRLYQPVEDGIGVASNDVLIGAGRNLLAADTVMIRLTRADTLAPRISRSISSGPRSVSVQFSEPIVFDTLAPPHLKIEETATGDSLIVETLWLDADQPRILRGITETQSSGSEYRVTGANAFDPAGNIQQAFGDTAVFTGWLGADTTSPQLVKSVPSPREKAANPFDHILFTFSEAMKPVMPDSLLAATDSPGVKIKGTLTWDNPMLLRFRPGARLQGRSMYRVRLDTVLMDLAGNRLDDTTFTFTTYSPDTLTEISGTIYDADSLASGTIVIQALPVNKGMQYSTAIETPGPYVIRNMLPGDYFLWTFRDSDMNGRYTYGTPWPFQPAERFTQLSDTIRTRSRWPNEGNNIKLPWK